MTTQPRPFERRVLAMRDEGMSLEEIGRRFRRSPEHIGRVAEWAAISRPGAGTADQARVLRPVEQRVIDLRDEGLSHEEIGRRFRRSADHIRRVEGLARYRQAGGA